VTLFMHSCLNKSSRDILDSVPPVAEQYIVLVTFFIRSNKKYDAPPADEKEAAPRSEKK